MGEEKLDQRPVMGTWAFARSPRMKERAIVNRCLRLTLVFGLFIAASTHQTPQANAQVKAEPMTNKIDAKRKINLSNREQMLAHYMAKALCMASLGIDEKNQINELKAAQFQFERTLVDLRDGNPAQRLLPESDLSINIVLDETEGLWYPYGQAATKRDLDAIISQNAKLTSKMNDVETAFQKKFVATQDITPARVASLSASGYPRMLTQKASMEFCLIAVGKDAVANRASLKATLELFNSTIRMLKTGNASKGLDPATNGEIVAQIERANAAWSKLEPIFSAAAGSATPSKDDIANVARDNVAAMESANTITDLYERLPD
jgi:hypothetical protein